VPRRHTDLIYDARMSLTQLRYFVAVAREGSVSRAAKKCFVSQPPMSRQVRALEDELRVTLFERHTRGMRLSREGRRVLAQSERILAMVDELGAPPNKV